MDATYAWLLTGHLIGVILWIGSMFAVYWLLRVHAQAPRDVLDKLTLMERSMALTMDIAATLAIGLGLVMAFSHGGTHPTGNLFADPNGGWFHIKLTAVVLGVLSVHGFIRARVGKFSRGKISPVPQWPWSLLLIAVVVIVVFVVRGQYPAAFAGKDTADKPAPTAPAKP